jgi:PIN domain nuclease of toxin-antitoxin system
VIILDTHIWVRWVDPEANPLPARILEPIESADQLAVSAITCWEVAWLVRRKRLNLLSDLTDWLALALDGSGVLCTPVSQPIAICAANLPEHHRDPADRLIIATAIQQHASLISLDSEFAAYADLAGTLIQ